MKILCICPSKHPDKLERMIATCMQTSGSNIEVIINDETKPITKIFNETFQSNPDYDFYHMMNDDTIYQTMRWDKTLASNKKITYGNDLIQGDNLCTFPMIDGDIVRALGWLQLPTLEHYCGDVVWGFIGRQSKCLEYYPEVIIEHLWDGQVNEEIHRQDKIAFARWLPWSFKDIKKLTEVLNGSKR